MSDSFLFRKVVHERKARCTDLQKAIKARERDRKVRHSDSVRDQEQQRSAPCVLPRWHSAPTERGVT